ncbi:hypothetical protein EDB19DRAFT_958924 [Suillus lakei]|nr:hypothetical protein EDB19DRAFT_958924 [Suillus lakei]
MGCTTSHQRLPRTPGLKLAEPVWSLPENLQDSNFLHVEASDSSQTITVVDGTLLLPRSSLAGPIWPLPEDHQHLELQVEVSDPSKTISTPVGIFSLPTELICHILLLLHFRDLSRCALACKTFWHVAQNSVDIQCLFELYSQGFTETPTVDWVDVSSKMHSLKRLASLWRSDFHLNTVFEEAVAADIANSFFREQSMKYGLWWMYAEGILFIRGCDTNTKLSQTLPMWSFVLPGLADVFYVVRSIIIDPLQDLAVAASFETGDERDRHVFSVSFRLASSRRPHPDSACTSLTCKHPCYVAPGYHIHFVGEPAICGDRIIILYYTGNVDFPGTLSNIFIQVIDWRKGRAKGYPLYELGGREANFHLLDEQRIVVIGPDRRMALYTLQELGGSPQRRIAYLLPNVRRGLDFYFDPEQISISPLYVIHASPSFHGAAVRPDLMPDYVTSPESQIMVLEVLSGSLQVILVIDMAIFSAEAVHSEIPVEIPWSEWGPKYARCFPHHPTHKISVFGSKMAYALPLDRTPDPGQRLEALPSEGSFYVHIWDFNRAIARSEQSRQYPRPQFTRSSHPQARSDSTIVLRQSRWRSHHESSLHYCCLPHRVFRRVTLTSFSWNRIDLL